MILVTGATGNVGKQVVHQLQQMGEGVRAMSRTPDKLAFASEVQTVRGDIADPASLEAALRGVSAVFLYVVPNTTAAFVSTAKQMGVRRIVFLSSGAVRDDLATQTDPIAAMHADGEAAIAASGLEWTFVRPSIFALNALSWAGQIRATGVVRGPFAEATGAPIHESDMAAVAVRALVSDGYVGWRLSVTGPESLTNAEQVRILGETLGRDLRFEEVPAEPARQAMMQHVPPFIVDALFRIWSDSVGHPARVLPTVEQVTGRPARTFAQWAADHRADFS